MGKLYEFCNYIAVSSNEKVYIVNKINLKIICLEVPQAKNNEKDIKKQELMEDRDEIVCLTASKDGKYVAATTQSKRLTLWSASSWSFLKQEALVKRPMAIAFLPDSSKIIVADKNGDVYSFPVNEESNTHKEIQNSYQDLLVDKEPGPEPLLGHLSMLLDMAITEDGKFLITSDRDEKIRVSCYPNCYNIHTFCLGHTEFVSRIKQLPNRNELVSASGDGQVKLWNFLSGECLATLDVRLQLEDFLQQRLQGSEEVPNEVQLKSLSAFVTKLEILSLEGGVSVLLVSFYRVPVVLFYEVEDSSRFRFLRSFETDSTPLDFVALDSGDVLVYLDPVGGRDPLAVFRFSRDFGCVQRLEDHPVARFGRDYRDVLIGKDVWSLDATSLYKHKYDNMADYQRKKQERLKSDQNIFPQKRKIST